jgi:hypothetical protein
MLILLLIGTTSIYAKYQLAAKMGKCCPGCHPVLFNFKHRPVSEPQSWRIPQIAAVSSRDLDGVQLLEQILSDARTHNVDEIKIPKLSQIKFEGKFTGH